MNAVEYEFMEVPETHVATPQSAPVVEIETIPSDLERLIKRSLSENDMSPIIKETLKQKIQTQRAVDGKAPIEVKFEEPKQYELTEEEKEKIEKRKERNRKSAHKSRVKRRCYEVELEEEIKRLENDKEKLEKEVKMFGDLEKRMRERFAKHMIKCLDKGKMIKAAGIHNVRQAVTQRQQNGGQILQRTPINNWQHSGVGVQQPTTSSGVSVSNLSNTCNQIDATQRRIPVQVDLNTKLIQLALLQQKFGQKQQAPSAMIPEMDIPVQQEICIDLG